MKFVILSVYCSKFKTFFLFVGQAYFAYWPGISNTIPSTSVHLNSYLSGVSSCIFQMRFYHFGIWKWWYCFFFFSEGESYWIFLNKTTNKQTNRNPWININKYTHWLKGKEYLFPLNTLLTWHSWFHITLSFNHMNISSLFRPFLINNTMLTLWFSKFIFIIIHYS